MATIFSIETRRTIRSTWIRCWPLQSEHWNHLASSNYFFFWRFRVVGQRRETENLQSRVAPAALLLSCPALLDHQRCPAQCCSSRHLCRFDTAGVHQCMYHPCRRLRHLYLADSERAVFHRCLRPSRKGILLFVDAGTWRVALRARKI